MSADRAREAGETSSGHLVMTTYLRRKKNNVNVLEFLSSCAKLLAIALLLLSNMSLSGLAGSIITGSWREDTPSFIDHLFFYGADGKFMEKLCFARDRYYWVFGTYQVNGNVLHVIFDHCVSENVRCSDSGQGFTWTDRTFTMQNADTLVTQTSASDPAPQMLKRIRDWTEYCH